MIGAGACDLRSDRVVTAQFFRLVQLVVCQKLDPAGRVVLDRSERMAVRADPAKERIGLCLMVHNGALQRGHGLLAIVDGAMAIRPSKLSGAATIRRASQDEKRS